jgi:hypothetical protein
MNRIIEYIDINHGSIGLSNQLGMIISGIIHAKYNYKRYVVISKFRTQYNSENTIPISNVLDLDVLSKVTGIKIIDSTKLSFKIKSIKYGNCRNQIDLTDVLGDIIPKSLDLNSLKGDPLVGIVKFIYITFEINGTIDTIIYKERSYDDIKLSEKLVSESYEWLSTYDINLFNDILRNTKFINSFYNISENIMKAESYGNLNVVHLRNEEDGILFWAKINNLSSITFKNMLHNKYISLFNKYIDKKDLTIILTSNNNCETVKYLTENGYNIKLTNKSFEKERELNAVVDLLVSQYCNNIFIGGVNPINYHGSTFSYVVWQRLQPKTTKVLFDLDDIQHKEFVVFD